MSTEWSAGYVTDVNYTFGYYGELNPLRCRLPLLTVGRHAPKIENACELGFGQGLSVSIHAAAQPGINWYGTDFNPSQAAFAAEMVRLSGAEAKLYDEAFAEFCNRKDLPDFDFIGLHGIWTWISDQNRHVLVDFIRRKLRPGGVLYISYNTLPGWSSSAPIRHLMKRHADVMGAPGQGVIGQTDAALNFIDQFLALDPLYAKVNPGAVERLKQVKAQDRKYLAHEYMNRDWHPMYFADVENWLGDAKVGFACSAHVLDNLYDLNMTPQQTEFMRDVSDVSLRETIRDFCMNQQFRRDYWVRGVRALIGHEQVAAMREERVVMTVAQADLPTKVRGVIGEATLNDDVYQPLFEILLDHKPHSVLELETHLASKSLHFGQLSSALTILLGLGVITTAAAAQDVSKAKARTLALNKTIARRSLSVGDIAYFASPITGGGITASRFAQLFWLSRQNGGKTAEDWASFAYQVLQGQGQAIIKDGATLQGEDNLTELRAQATHWGAHVLPIWNALGV
ncbi:class I SAM-dependent methyltransferase [Caulobacter vibrioides]|uniref:Methyltransferase n=1 Tax=Caulobacter vibrioides (strain NA1000 / CB15N) TaxID=565050 RepID=A0A0H3C8J9_CAUVN|nr:class I SAM-dependent methyltransferase [Caulobacter vibrioides]YP_002516442.2 methyltransferase [Caulobacter vibrioides NA1000]ACL94534.2 methyltransferase [Caulobacter vibrioides NA1000]QXZ53095.1 class I SAM-dependent methyltransferase [Caulobacter vibrioides]